MNEETRHPKCNCTQHPEGIVVTIKTPHRSCTVSYDSDDISTYEVLNDLVLPALEGIGYTIQPGYIDVKHYTEE
tara:strand:+ start:2364 stop:2585 length:222 start_codon:yes stop_codon:yes gene_type:complete